METAKKRIYIVDDDRNIVESLTIVLKKEGFEVASQNDEIQVVDNVAAFKPDCLILDVMFPEDHGAGFEMARALRRDDRTHHIPILMLSAVNEKGVYAGTFSNKDIDESLLPVNQFVEKPINPKELINRLHQLLSSK